MKVKEEYDTYEYMDDDVCVLNYRGGEYVGFHELYLTREYWLNAMENMTKINPNMKFVTITDDVKHHRLCYQRFQPIISLLTRITPSLRTQNM